MFYQNAKNLTFFDQSDLSEIESFSKGMSKEEVLEYYALTIEDLKDSNKEDYKYFTIAFNRGRSIGKHAAVDALFTQMRQKGGHQPAISYLRRFAQDWPVDDDQIDNESGDGKFTFNVTMN